MKIIKYQNSKHQELWDDYEGKPDDSLEIEIYEHWLEAN